MWRSITIVLVQSVACWAWATEQSPVSCEPVYKPIYKSCINSTSPVVAEDRETDWILTNKGASIVSEGICTDSDKIAAYAAAHPTASNIQFKDIKAKKNAETMFKRGVGKSDVYCKYTVNVPVQKPTLSEECGVVSVERTGCVDNISVDFIKKCLSLPSISLTQAWLKGSCLVDSLRLSPTVAGLDSETFAQVEFQLKMAKKAYLASPSDEFRALARYLTESTHD
jgi:hypothetical protein